MKQLSSIILISVLSCLILSGQQYLPLNVQKAYQNKTRSEDGKPGPNYWQNSADYKIDATLDTKTEQIRGTATIDYYNNSPDTLKSIIFRLYQDFFRKGNARQWAINEGDLMEGTAITRLVIDGINYDPREDFPRWYMTNFRIRLKDFILPGSEATIEIEWSFDIPTVRGLRMRKYDDGHYFIAYWYPQVAVYDDVDGWDLAEYTGIVEFYNDQNNFDVRITVPEDYMVWATGIPVNIDDILQNDIISRYQKAKKSDEIIQIITREDYEKNRVFQASKKNTWHYEAEHVPDFSFAASNQSNWDGTSIVVDKRSGRRVFVDAVYPDGSENWERGAEVARESIEYMSFELPGVPFPYPKMTSFCSGTRGGGMETPMMANNGTPKSFGSFLELMFHEIAHTYFPFYMGTNERKYAWMDEGWAAYLPNELSEELVPAGDYLKKRVELYEDGAGQENELPLMVPTFQHNSFTSARQAAYDRPAIAYHLLRDALGNAMFKKALITYIDRWNGKHPLPYDFFNTFEDVTGESLDWFWKTWFYGNGYPDLAIENVTSNNKVSIKKAGSFPVPVSLLYYTRNGKSGKHYENTSVWKDGSASITVELPQNLDIIKIVLGNDHIPDMDEANNLWENVN